MPKHATNNANNNYSPRTSSARTCGCSRARAGSTSLCAAARAEPETYQDVVRLFKVGATHTSIEQNVLQRDMVDAVDEQPHVRRHLALIHHKAGAQDGGEGDARRDGVRKGRERKGDVQQVHETLVLVLARAAQAARVLLNINRVKLEVDLGEIPTENTQKFP